jgi:CRISPR-associated endonuclease Csn1
LLTDGLKRQFDDPMEDDSWRHKGVIFGQRRTYWDTGTLGRCDLEPTDQRCPLADMHAQEFRVVETVNNLRIDERGKNPRPLTGDERARVIAALRSQKSASAATIRKALGIDRKAIKEFFSLNIEHDPDREINTDWFYREVVHGAFTEGLWRGMTESQRESVNRAILKFDPDQGQHEHRLRQGAKKWWGLPDAAVDKLVAAWKSRPRLEKRINLSRRAIKNLLPYMNEFDSQSNRWPTQIEARQRFAEDGNAIDRTTGQEPIQQQRDRYALKGHRLTKAERHFLKKHPSLLPPAPMLANPVVRKAIHEVRSHVIAYLRKYGRKPDRIVIELTREAKQTAKVRNQRLSANRKREMEKKKMVEEFKLRNLTLNQQSSAIERVLLCRQQKGVCAYSGLARGEGRAITEKTAAEGTDLEIDHIVPLSRSQDNSLNNKVLCFRDANRNKGNQTPKEWLSPEQYQRLEQRFRHWKKELPRKWENLHRDPEPPDEFVNSQLTDTAYAATQVGSYLANALYGGATEGHRRVFFTKGIYTAMLRRDWQLFQTLKKSTDDPSATDRPDPEQETNLVDKNRGDHRHHAIDAVVVALTGPEIVQEVARLAREREEYHERTGFWPKRTPIDPPTPWANVHEFRQAVLSKIFETFDPNDAHLSGTNDRITTGQPLVVSHRPVKRKVTGYLHKEDLWGAVNEPQGIYRKRYKVSELSPPMLRMPVEETDDQVRQRLFKELKRAGLSDKDARHKARELVEKKKFKRRLIDPPLGKGGLVRDWGIRKTIRECLQNNGLDPNTFTAKQIADLAKTGKLTMPSGVPIKSVITIGPIADPIKIPVQDPYTRQQALNPRTGQPLFRFHFSRNNHHVEILEDIASGKWSGDCVTMFQAAARVRPPKDAHGNRQKPKPAVNRTDRDGKRFVMSLSEGETICALRPDCQDGGPGSTGYFVVAKLDANRIWFAPHYDARNADKQDRWDVTYAKLKECGPEPGRPPYKVAVSPLGEVRPLAND